MVLRNQQRVFVEHYLRCWNATEAALAAGYSPRSARQQGSRLLSHADIKDAIKQRVDEIAMSADEVLLRLSDQARATMEDFIDPSTATPDLATANARHKLHLIKKFSRTETDKSINVTIELYDAQAALIQLGRYHGLFKDKTDFTSGGQPVNLNLERLAALAAVIEAWERERFGGRGES